MDELIHINTTFEKTIFTNKRIEGREFDSCIFKNCDFSGSAFVGCIFSDCEFVDCNLALSKFTSSSLKTVHFELSKVMGIRFDECEDFLFDVSFIGCMVDYSWFTNKKMHKAKFINSSLKDVNFSNADLTKATFDGSNLAGTLFSATKLVEANFSNAVNYQINPEQNMVKKAMFSVDGLAGLLTEYDIKII